MAGEGASQVVVDASVAAKLYFREPGSEVASRLLKSDWTLIAPDLLFIEVASVAAKRVRRELSAPADAAFATRSVRALIDKATPTAELSDRALEIALMTSISAYDGCYLALAEKSGCQVLTADALLAQRATDGGLGALVMLLEAS
ncbi:MAG TPA: type II toxin-antitoxin system VapC family toxin [Caulobacteraceae bacterium]|jgi:predicted nucleic acid-binding protein